MDRPIDYIMVPKGAEYNAVYQGLSRAQSQKIELVSLPVGPQPVTHFLKIWCNQHVLSPPHPRILMMGLCGSLTVDHKIGDVVLYESCLDGRIEDDVSSLPCDFDLSTTLSQILGNTVTRVTGVMCDRVISQATIKQSLGKKYAASVVDMESFAALATLKDYGVSPAIIRVISDDANHDVPDLNQAFDDQGNIRPATLAKSFLSQPLGAMRLIRGSLSGLNVMRGIVAQIIIAYAK